MVLAANPVACSGFMRPRESGGNSMASSGALAPNRAAGEDGSASDRRAVEYPQAGNAEVIEYGVGRRTAW